MDPVKIAHVVDTMKVGGAETLIAQLCRIQLAGGLSPAVHCIFENGPVGERLAGDGVPVSTGSGGRGSRVRALWNFLREFRPNVVHCHNAFATVQTAPLAWLLGVPAVVSTRHGLVPAGKKTVQEIKFWLAARFCNYVVAVCAAAHENLLRGPGAIRSKLVTIRNGSAAAPRGDVRPVREGFTLAHVARLTPVKDQASLLQAVAQARTGAPDLRLWIIGDGPLRGELEGLAKRLQIQDCVSFVGERKDVGSWLEAADVFVLSSISEGLPVSILEAMAAGLPVLVTRIGGMPEMVELAGGGLVVPPSDPPALAAAILNLHARRADLPRLGAANRRLYAESLTLESMADAYRDLYTKAAGRRF